MELEQVFMFIAIFRLLESCIRIQMENLQTNVDHEIFNYWEHVQSIRSSEAGDFLVNQTLNFFTGQPLHHQRSQVSPFIEDDKEEFQLEYEDDFAFKLGRIASCVGYMLEWRR